MRSLDILSIVIESRFQYWFANDDQAQITFEAHPEMTMKSPSYKERELLEDSQL